MNSEYTFLVHCVVVEKLVHFGYETMNTKFMHSSIILSNKKLITFKKEIKDSHLIHFLPPCMQLVEFIRETRGSITNQIDNKRYILRSLYLIF